MGVLWREKEKETKKEKDNQIVINNVPASITPCSSFLTSSGLASF